MSECPGCSSTIQEETECPYCGIVLAKARANEGAPPRPTRIPVFEAPPDPLDSPGEFGREEAKALAIGLGLAIVIYALDFPNFLLSTLVTLFHEIGHSIVAWAFGYPAVPAFDFSYGGGFSIQMARQPLLVVLVLGGFAWLLYVFRRNRRTLTLLGILTASYAILALTGWHRTLIGAMGHGGELLFAGLFLYRGLSGSGCKTPLERPLYAFVGIFAELKVIGFSLKLASDSTFLRAYEEGKRGILNDLHDIALDFQLNLGFAPGTAGVALFLAMTALLPPVAAVLYHRYRPTCRSFARSFLQLDPGREG